jgi:glycosyltransferase involved in cell wall biosynthesis
LDAAPIRIMLVSDEINLGGAELSLLELCRALARHCDVHLALDQRILANPAFSAAWSSRRGSTHLHPCTARLYPGTIANIHRKLRRRPAGELAGMIAEIQPSVILVNLPTVERGQAIVDAADLVTPRVPVWGFLHSANRPSMIGAKLGPVRDLLVPKLLRRFDHLLTVSAAGAQKISGRYQMDPPDILHPPISTYSQPLSKELRSASRITAGLPDSFLLGIIGRIEALHKGQDTAVRVTARLIEAGYPVHLVVMGEGPDTSAIGRLARRLQISASVSFLGWRQDAGELILLLSAVIMPSKHEGMPLTALQAAAAQVPVIGYAVDGLAELLPEGFKIPYGDEVALGNAMAALIEGLRIWPAEEMAERAQAWSDPNNAAERLLTLLRNSLGEGQGMLLPPQRA